MSKKKLTLVFFKRGLEEVLEEKWLSSMFFPIVLSCDFILLMQFSIVSFENIITGIHFHNKKDNQKLKHGGK